MEMWAQLKKFSDGEDLNADTLNVPIGQLGDRTTYLYNRLRELFSSDSKSSLILSDVELSTEEGRVPAVGNAVYLDNKHEVFAAAKATMSLCDDFTASDSAFTVGILLSRDGNSNKGDVLLYGNMSLNPSGVAIPVSSIIESGEDFRPGRYYLSANEAGHLTAHPTGPLIYVCTISGEVSAGGLNGTALVAPNFLDIGTSHVHRSARLVARPAGELSEDGKHVLGYGTTVDGPYHLLFGGTWTGRRRGMSYKFKLGVDSQTSGLLLMWNEGADTSSDTYAHSVPISAGGDPVDVSNGLTARLLVDGDATGASDDQKTWDPLVFPEAGRGWVDHVTYDGDPDPDAKYDYVLGMDQYVSNYWPPVPAKSAALVVNGVEMDNKAFFPDNPTVSFGRDTIHWYCDVRGKMPWPDLVRRRYAEVDAANDKTEVMHWVRGFQGATGPVTSLQARPGSPIKIYGYGSDKTANTGDLEISAELDFTLEDEGLPGFMVPKDSKDGKMLTGPVVERIVAGPGVSVMSKSGCPKGQGTVIIGLDNGAYRNHFTDIALENAEQAKIGMFPYIRLKGYSGSSISHPSAFTAMMRVPDNLPDTTYALRVYASVFGENGMSGASAQSACIKLEYNILPDLTAPDAEKYSSLKTALLKPDSDRTILIPFGHIDEDTNEFKYNGFDPVLVSTDDPDLYDEADVIEKVFGKSIPDPLEFSAQRKTPDLKPGYLVGIRISRAVTPSGAGVVPYTGPLGFLNLSWELVQSVNDQTTSRDDQYDVYVPNKGTGLYHEVVAVTDSETGEVNLGIEQEGVER